MLKIGIIGAGFMGQNHARIIGAGAGPARIAGICDAVESRAGALAESAGAELTTTSPEALIDHVDAVIVASSDETHVDFVLKCIAANKPVLCEKPLAADSAGCLRVVEAETALGRRLVQVAYMRRYDPGYMAMKTALDDGRYGRPLFFHCIHRNARAPHFISSETVLTNAVVHEIDVARHLLGEEFDRVMVMTPPASRHAPDRLPQLVVLQSASGVVVDVEAFLDAQYGYDVRGELVCEEGTVSLAPLPPVSLRHAGRDGYSVEETWIARFEAAYRGLLGDWIRSAVEGKPSGSGAWDGYVATLTAEACVRSWKSGLPASVDCPKAQFPYTQADP